MSATIAWISIAPVKGMRMQQLTEVELTNRGAVDDRQFFLVDEKDSMISVTRIGPLLEIVPEYSGSAAGDARASATARGDAGGAPFDSSGAPATAERTLALNFPDGSVVSGPIQTGKPLEASFYGLGLDARLVGGPFSEAISDHCGVNLRLVESPPNRNGVDRGAIGGVTLLGTGSIERLEEAAAEAGQPGPIDERRFRMNLGVSGIAPHEEDTWTDRKVRVGETAIEVREKVGRCAATTRDPEAGCVDLKTLHHIRSYREDVPSLEPLPFGVYASVKTPGTVRLGDPVEALPAA